MTKKRLSAKKSLGLGFLALALNCPGFASPTAPLSTATTSRQENSLEGWDGHITNCSDSSSPACWNATFLYPYNEKKSWYPVVSLGAGAVITSTVGQSKTFPIQDPITDEFYIYNAQKTSQTGALFEIFLGSEWAFHPSWKLQTGVDFNQVYTNYNTKGTLTQGADAQSADQFTYSYSAIIRQVMAEAKLLYNYQKRFHPYLLLGLGAAFNTTYGFSADIPAYSTFTRQYSNYTNTAFTYAAGFGLDYDLTEEIRLGAGYRFTDLGSVELGPATINNINVSGTVTQDHLYSNVLLAQLTFVF